MSFNLENTSHANINNGENFTGTAVDCLTTKISKVTVNINADQILSVKIQESSDGSNFTDSVSDSYTSVNDTKTYYLSIKERFFRVKVANSSGVNTSKCRIDTKVKKNGFFETEIINGSIVNANAGIPISIGAAIPVTQSGLWNIGQYGNWYTRMMDTSGNVISTDNSALCVHPVDDFNFSLSKNYTDLNKSMKLYAQGERSSVSTMQYELVSQTQITGFPTFSLDLLQVGSGGNGSDDILGTGARKVFVLGEGEYNLIVGKEVELAGSSSSSSTTPVTFKSVLGAYVSEAGTGLTNAGDIVIQNYTGPAQKAIIKAGEGRMNSSVIFVEDGFNVMITKLIVSTTGAVRVRVMGTNCIQNYNTTAPTSGALHKLCEFYCNTGRNEFDMKFILPAGSYCYVQAKSISSQYDVSATLEYYRYN